jgi:NitT/TauT family transport system substrate-binding protein
MPACNSIPLVVAAAADAFGSQGISVELVSFNGQLERETALQTGALDGTVSDLINGIQSWSHGFCARVTSVTEGNFALLTSPQSAMKSLSDWPRGGSVNVRTGLLENSIVYYLTERMLASAGADPARVELVPIVQVPARLEMLLAGKVDAACLPEPLATLAASRGAHILADSDGMSTTPGVLLFTHRALSGKAASIAAFYRAYDAAVDLLNAGPERYRAVIVSGCAFPPQLTSLLRIPRFRHAFLPPEDLVADVGKWMMNKGLVDKVPSYSEIISAGYISDHARAP